jgi:hypothetical protein
MASVEQQQQDGLAEARLVELGEQFETDPAASLSEKRLEVAAACLRQVYASVGCPRKSRVIASLSKDAVTRDEALAARAAGERYSPSEGTTGFFPEPLSRRAGRVSLGGNFSRVAVAALRRQRAASSCSPDDNRSAQVDRGNRAKRVWCWQNG